MFQSTGGKNFIFSEMSYDGYAKDFKYGNIYHAFIRGNHANQLEKWWKVDEFEGNNRDFTLGPMAVEVHHYPMGDPDTLHKVNNAMWVMGNVKLRKKAMKPNFTHKTIWYEREMFLVIDMQPTYRFERWLAGGIPSLALRQEVASGAPDVLEEEMTVVQLNSETEYKARLPVIKSSYVRRQGRRIGSPYTPPQLQIRNRIPDHTGNPAAGHSTATATAPATSGSAMSTTSSESRSRTTTRSVAPKKRKPSTSSGSPSPSRKTMRLWTTTEERTQARIRRASSGLPRLEMPGANTESDSSHAPASTPEESTEEEKENSPEEITYGQEPRYGQSSGQSSGQSYGREQSSSSGQNPRYGLGHFPGQTTFNLTLPVPVPASTATKKTGMFRTAPPDSSSATSPSDEDYDPERSEASSRASQPAARSPIITRTGLKSVRKYKGDQTLAAEEVEKLFLSEGSSAEETEVPAFPASLIRAKSTLPLGPPKERWVFNQELSHKSTVPEEAKKNATAADNVTEDGGIRIASIESLQGTMADHYDELIDGLVEGNIQAIGTTYLPESHPQGLAEFYANNPRPGPSSVPASTSTSNPETNTERPASASSIGSLLNESQIKKENISIICLDDTLEDDFGERDTEGEDGPKGDTGGAQL